MHRVKSDLGHGGGSGNAYLNVTEDIKMRITIAIVLHRDLSADVLVTIAITSKKSVQF